MSYERFTLTWVLTSLVACYKLLGHIFSFQFFSEFPPHLQEYIEFGLQGLEPPTKPEGPVLPASLAAMLAPPSANVPQVYKGASTVGSAISSTKSSTTPASTISTRPSIANSTNIDTLLVATEKEEKTIAPPDTLQDKIAFIFNNLSQLNLKVKCDELREHISDEYYPWLSQYLVMKRASIEFNFHNLYSNCVDALNINELYKMVVKETFRYVSELTIITVFDSLNYILPQKDIFSFS